MEAAINSEPIGGKGSSYTSLTLALARVSIDFVQRNK